MADTNQKPHAKLFIDGANLLCLGTRNSAWMPTERRRSDGRPWRDPPRPRLDYVEALVAACEVQQVAFCVVFDAPCPFWFKSSDARGEGLDLVRRFGELRRRLADRLVVCSSGVKGDNPLIVLAEKSIDRGFQPFLVSQDQFTKENERELGPRLFKDVNQKSGLPRALAAVTVADGSLLVFAGSSCISAPLKQADKPAADQPKPRVTHSLGAVELERDGLYLQAIGDGISVAANCELAAVLGRRWPLRVGCGADCDLRIPDAPAYRHVSSVHFEIDRRNDGSFWITDMSSNGTYLAARRLHQGVATPLRGTGTIGLALPASVDHSALVLYRAPDDVVAEPAAEEATESSRAGTERDGAPGTLGAGPTGYMLHLRLADSTRQVIALPTLPCKLGTGPATEVSAGRCSLAEADCLGISREHLVLAEAGSALGVHVTNCGRNGTYMDSRAQPEEFMWPVAERPYDDTQPSLVLGKAGMDAGGRALKPVQAWLTRN